MRSLYGVIGIPLFFSKIWRPLCSLFDRHGCFLFFKFTLASGVFARAGVECERYSKTAERGVDICSENSENKQKYLHRDDGSDSSNARGSFYLRVAYQ